MAAGITTLCMLGSKLNADAIHTVHFLDHLDKLFDVFNSSTLANADKFRCGITEQSNQVTFLKESITWLDNITYLDNMSQHPVS